MPTNEDLDNDVSMSYRRKFQRLSCSYRPTLFVSPHRLEQHPAIADHRPVVGGAGVGEDGEGSHA